MNLSLFFLEPFKKLIKILIICVTNKNIKFILLTPRQLVIQIIQNLIEASRQL